ncbi:hypothetical protein [Dokdonella sp.]|uniref:hypothetical protein n=1 Tax=Dokdonella sp. TaxID=2291710 RepID=UPI003C6F0991
MLNIDPATGNVSIDLGADFNCYPSPVGALANNASLSVTGPTTVGGGVDGVGGVNLILNTGLSTTTPGVTCVPDSYISTNVNITSGWTNALCGPANCGPTVGRAVAVQNPSASLDGSITFKAKCTYQDQTNANLVSERRNINSSPSVTVLHGTTPQVNFCQSVSELSNTYGLTPEMRQLTGTVTGGLYPGSGLDFTEYTSVFGTALNTYPTGNPDNVGYGFPGDNPTNVQIGLQRNKYISFKFRAPSNTLWTVPPYVGSLLVIPGNAYTLASIAPCPGQFASDPNFPNNLACHIVGKQSNLNFEINAGSTARCQLIPGNTYYLNLINASFPNLTTTTCPSSQCSPKVNRQGQNP